MCIIRQFLLLGQVKNVLTFVNILYISYQYFVLKIFYCYRGIFKLIEIEIGRLKMETKEMFYSYCTERNENGFAPVTVVIGKLPKIRMTLPKIEINDFEEYSIAA